MHIDKSLCIHNELKSICKWHRDGNCVLNIINEKDAPCYMELKCIETTKNEQFLQQLRTMQNARYEAIDHGDVNSDRYKQDIVLIDEIIKKTLC